MKTKKIIDNKYVKNILLMVGFGLLSAILGFIRFNMPGVEGASSDFRELPLLISVFYFTNPIYLVGVSFITALTEIPQDGSLVSTFLMHAGGLVFIWSVYRKIKKIEAENYVIGIIWFVTTFFYYAVLIVIMILTNYLVDLNTEKPFVNFFVEVTQNVYFEATTAASVSALFLVQYMIRAKLIEHQENLETIVKERTKDLRDTIEELKTTQKQLVESEKMASLGVLSSGIAHEINNPLNFIQGGVFSLEQFIEENKLEDNSKISFILKSINTGIQRASDIISSLHNFSQHNEAANEQADITDIINNCLLILHNQIKDNIKVTWNISKEPYLLFGNIGRLHQAILNILTNAVQSIKEKGEIIIETRINGQFLEVIFADTGCGIDQEILSKITEPFFTTKSPGKGTGLGLSICYSIIKEHKGKLKFSSNINRGTTVMLSLPIEIR